MPNCSMLSLFYKSTLSFIALTFCLAVALPAKGEEVVSVSVVADGLDNPRGLNFAPDGSLYVIF